MKLKSNLLAVALLFFASISCKTAQTNMIVADSYDQNKKQTTLILFPYGNMVLPDKWTKISFNQVSRQHFFKNADSTTVGVAKNPKSKYPFYAANQTEEEFTTAFVKWDANYWAKKGLKTEIINDQSNNGFIIWRVSDANKKEVNNIFLFGSKNGLAYNLSGTSKVWTDEKIQTFLIKIFSDN
ncbi:hypothetical protein ACFQ48_03270 [Hymenobacter caeli]|uniref:DUF3805 domain-containing protein n=1 Tax=Hymenobacter caeli TaxID=2735894 RepID=A0ABX2FL46_9BACT|nr:hypothetical protein [Hymenobacter caeli]NRT17848.1 hypothetical protein [Hymenobacter caeli]